MRRSVLLLLTALCLLMPGAANAVVKRPPLTLFTESSSSGVGGLPFNVEFPHKGYYESPIGSFHIFDVRNGSARSFAIPARCEGHGISLPVLFLRCQDAPAYRVWDSWTGATTAVDASACGSDRQRSISLAGIGRYWIAGQYHTGTFDHEYGNEYVEPVYINRQTGECRAFTDASDLDRDLDSPDLAKPDRGPKGCGGGRKYVTRYRSPSMYVKRCVAHARLHYLCRQCTLSAGRNLVSWVDRGVLHAYLVAGGRRLKWTLRGHPGQDEANVRVLGDRLYVNVYPAPVKTWVTDLSRLVRR